MPAREIANGAQLLEARTDEASAAGGAFEQQLHGAGVEALGGLGDAVHEVDDRLVHALAAVAAGMCDQILGADRGSALELSAKGKYRFRADGGVDRGQVDQIVVMYHERLQIEGAP